MIASVNKYMVHNNNINNRTQGHISVILTCLKEGQLSLQNYLVATPINK